MKATLKKIKLDLDELEVKNYEKLEFERLIEGSLREWTENKGDKEKINWLGEILIENEDGDFVYNIDTKSRYIASLDLDGYLSGEKIDIDEDVEILLSSKTSYIYELLIFHEISKLNILSEDRLKALELSLFPKWASGFLADNISNNEIMKEFLINFESLINEFEIVKKLKIDTSSLVTECKDELVSEVFKGSIKDYIDKEIFFIVYDKEYGKFLSKQEVKKVLLAVKKFNPNLEEIELYG